MLLDDATAKNVATVERPRSYQIATFDPVRPQSQPGEKYPGNEIGAQQDESEANANKNELAGEGLYLVAGSKIPETRSSKTAEEKGNQQEEYPPAAPGPIHAGKCSRILLNRELSSCHGYNCVVSRFGRQQKL